MRIRLNGQWKTCDVRRLHALRAAECGPDAQDFITIYNGFATPEDQPLQEGDEIVLIRQGEMPPREALEAMLGARHTPGVYQQVKRRAWPWRDWAAWVRLSRWHWRAPGWGSCT